MTRKEAFDALRVVSEVLFGANEDLAARWDEQAGELQFVDTTDGTIHLRVPADALPVFPNGVDAGELGFDAIGRGTIAKLTDKHDEWSFLPFKNVWQFLDATTDATITVTDGAGGTYNTDAVLARLFDGDGESYITVPAQDWPLTVEIDYGSGTIPDLSEGSATFAGTFYPSRYPTALTVEVAHDSHNGGAYETVFDGTGLDGPVIESGPVGYHGTLGNRHAQRIRLTFDAPNVSGSTGVHLKDLYAIKGNAELTGNRYVPRTGGNFLGDISVHDDPVATTTDLNNVPRQRTIPANEVDLDGGESFTLGYVDVPEGQTARVTELQVMDENGDATGSVRLEAAASIEGYLGGTKGRRLAGSPLYEVSGPQQLQFYFRNTGTSTAAASGHATVEVE